MIDLLSQAHFWHLITAMAYFVVGFILFACGFSIGFRFMLLRNEVERSLTFKLVGVFVYACFLDHGADALTNDYTTLLLTSFFEALVSAGTAAFLTFRALSRWRT